jgi:hypothetical protein
MTKRHLDKVNSKKIIFLSKIKIFAIFEDLKGSAYRSQFNGRQKQFFAFLG